jgi:hypothetical protein
VEHSERHQLAERRNKLEWRQYKRKTLTDSSTINSYKECFEKTKSSFQSKKKYTN